MFAGGQDRWPHLAGGRQSLLCNDCNCFRELSPSPRRWLAIVGGQFATIVLDEGGWRRSDVTLKISSDFPTTVVWLASVTRRIWCRLEASQSQSWRAWPRPRPPLHAGGYHIVVRCHRVRVHKLR